MRHYLMPRWIKISFVIIFTALQVFSHYLVVNAKDPLKITSKQDFYEKLSDQIYSHEVDITYKIDDVGLINTIMDMGMEDYAAHYNPNKPLTSGCYLSYYLDYMNLYYRNHTLRVVIQFKYSKDEMDKHFKKIQDLAEELKGKNRFESVKNVHDYLIRNFEYDKKTFYINHTDIEGFRDGVMVCSGYSLAAFAILNSMGIKTRVITGYGGSGTSDESNHMWNAVCLDEKWYNMDITWDDTKGKTATYKYFLKNDKDFPNHKRLGYYNTSDFDVIIAEKSYDLPAIIGFREILIYFIVVFAMLSITILLNLFLERRLEKKYFN